MEPAVRIELTTVALQMRSSTTELHGQIRFVLTSHRPLGYTGMELQFY